SPIAILNPVPLKIVVDSVLGSRPLPPVLQALLPSTPGPSPAAVLAIAIGLLLGVTALGQLQGLATTLVRTYIGERLVLDFRSQLVQQVQRLSLSYHHSRGIPEFVHRSQEGVTARIRLAVLEGGYGVLIGLVTALGMAAVLFIGVGHVRSGALTLGQLLLVLGYLGQLYDPLKTMSRKATGLQGYLASAERAFALLDEQPEVPERPHARPIARATGAVAFEGVSFAYGPDRPVLNDVSFVIAPGTRLGVVGATGAGKATLISLLSRFYDPTAGQILLDGVDLRDYKLADLRRQFAVVLQEPVLFSASIAENIAYAA